jgi:hypothetical protein
MSLRAKSHEMHTIQEQSSMNIQDMDLEKLDEKIDRLSIRNQLELLVKNLSEAKNNVEISNVLWEKVVAADGLLNAEELILFDTAADKLIYIRSLLGCRSRQRHSK